MKRSKRAPWRDAWGIVQGHAWTVGRDLQHRLALLDPRARLRGRGAGGEPWSTNVEDPDFGSIRLTGWWHPGRAEAPAVLVVHGLGGDADSPHCVRLARACERRGWGCLRLSLRGADRLGEDLYHAGLDADLERVVRAAPLARARDVFVVGFSLGGHAALRLGLHPPPRVRAIAAVGSPLSLQRSCAAIDRTIATPYRRVVLASLGRAFEAVARRRPMSASVSEVRRLRTIRGWDELVVVPRFGFADVYDYWGRASVGPHLHDLQLPSLYVGSRFDPMVPLWTVQDALRRANPLLTTHMLEVGGHVGFPGGIGLGEVRAALEDHVVAWLAGHAAGSTPSVLR